MFYYWIVLCLCTLSEVINLIYLYLFFPLSATLEFKFLVLCGAFFSQTTHPIWKKRHNCLFLFIDLVIRPNQGARPNYAAFVLVIPDTYFWLRASSLWLEYSSARAAQLVENAHGDTSYARTHWLNWKNKAFGQSVASQEWSSHC